MPFEPRQARIPDIKELHAFLLGDAANNRILPRSLSDLYAHTRDFYLVRDEQGLLAGCCALSLIWEDLAEIRSLLVREELRGKGLGRVLVEACAGAAREIGIRRLFTLTYESVFFDRLGFYEVGKDVLPHKIWADCINCPKFPDCDEIAMQRNLVS